jgi:menaquinone-dependent protoporphyrinogen IX oxidase
MSEENKTQIELSDSEKSAIRAVRKQSDAKTQAEGLLGKRVRTKQIRGYCCLFVGGANNTNAYGITWQEAFVKLLFRHKLNQASEKSASLCKSVASAKSVVPI